MLARASSWNRRSVKIYWEATPDGTCDRLVRADEPRKALAIVERDRNGPFGEPSSVYRIVHPSKDGIGYTRTQARQRAQALVRLPR
jgi:hypothetical protein